MKDQKRIPKRPEVSGRKSSGARRLTTAFILLLVIAVLVISTVVLNVLRRRAGIPGLSSDTSGGNASIGITALSVTGNQIYSEQDILGASGLRLGQSVWSVSTAQVQQNILSLCPYVDRAEVVSPSFGVYRIDITETAVLGALYDNGEWVVVGENGNALERLPVNSDRPPRMMYLKGLVYSGEGLGKPASDERSIVILRSVASALREEQVTGIAEIDLTDKTDLRINWNNQITVKLGGEGRIAYKISLVRELLPRILQSHGEQVCGTLDLSAYSSEEVPDQAFFTVREQRTTRATATTVTSATVPDA